MGVKIIYFVSLVLLGGQTILSTLTGKTGGRTDSARQPNKNSTAPPQTIAWHGPMPQRVCNFADRHERCERRRSNVRSSQRQTIVCDAAKCFNSCRTQRCGSKDLQTSGASHELETTCELRRAYRRPSVPRSRLQQAIVPIHQFRCFPLHCKYLRP